MRYRDLRGVLASSVAIYAVAVASPAMAQTKSFNIPAQSAASGITALATQADVQILVSEEAVRGKTIRAIRGSMTVDQAIRRVAADAGLHVASTDGRTYTLAPVTSAANDSPAADTYGNEIVVTAQKRAESVQDVPISVSAFTQENLERSQVAGGPDLITQVPNMTFTKTNFTSYSIQIRGIGTQAISVTTDPAVAISFNNTSFIRNRFFEQEFYDLERLEVLRGPQGTLYGRNATGGVVNLISTKPDFDFGAKASFDLANYKSRRLEGMVNIPVVDDLAALRVAGAWTKRGGFATNDLTGKQIDGRDLWSTRVSLRVEPSERVSANLIWEHFEEKDDRLRSGKQLCKKNVVDEVGGLPVPPYAGGGGTFQPASYVSQGCERVSLYSQDAFQTPNGAALPFFGPTMNLGNPLTQGFDPYLNSDQSHDLRVIESSVEPDYRANADLFQLQLNVGLSDSLNLTSETAYSMDSVWSLQDYNRFASRPGAFQYIPDGRYSGAVSEDGVFCDHQLGCTDRLLMVDLSTSESTQFSQELRLASDFDGPMNFSLGANYLKHKAIDKYYVFVNTLSLFNAWNNVFTPEYIPGVSDNSGCLPQGVVGGTAPYFDPTVNYLIAQCTYMDPNPIGSLNDQGRQYFLSKNPYELTSYAAFGELYYNVTPNLKLTGGLRWTVDQKKSPQVRSWLLASDVAGPYPVSSVAEQKWREPTWRVTLDWKPELGFTDETLIYGSYARGYKAGGANPPPPVFATYGPLLAPEILPDTFDAEYVDAFEIGIKNTLLNGALTLNLAGFYYDYEGYQISEIRNRAAVNSNYDAEIWGLELEADWRVTRNLRLGFKGGYNRTRIGDGQSAIDLMDRTAGNPDWMVIRPFPTIPSSCILPVDVITAGGRFNIVPGTNNVDFNGACVTAYLMGLDPVTGRPYDPTITDYSTAPGGSFGIPLGPAFADYMGFDPSTAPNGGAGFSKDLGGNELPNAPRYTTTVTADFTVPLSDSWLMNLHADWRWQSKSWWRIFNDHEYNRLRSFSTVNLATTFINDDAGWKVMAYVKNVFNKTALTGAFLNSDDTGLTTNVFLTEPRLYGMRVTKEFGGSGWLGGFGAARGHLPITLEIGGGLARSSSGRENYAPDWMDEYSPSFPMPSIQDRKLKWNDTRSAKLTVSPTAGWLVSGAYRAGSARSGEIRGEGLEAVPGGFLNGYSLFFPPPVFREFFESPDNHFRGAVRDSEKHEIIDFKVGRVLDSEASSVKSTISGGLRYAKLRSTTTAAFDGIPNRISPEEWTTPLAQIVYAPYADLPFRSWEQFTTTLDSTSSFKGTGPWLGWDASMRLLGSEDTGRVNLDWSIGGAVLFGKQRMTSEETRLGKGYVASSLTPPADLIDDVVSRERVSGSTATVPNISLSLGLSYDVGRLKLSTGYSYDRFFNAIDGGYEDAKSYDRTVHGPFVKFAIGF
ncbi:TonB-dependent receptor [Sphingopyxis sp.]|jgi:outer membrane receptor protein involved in Fe transport|uniref:TonB-dependent receptor n=1 Tax=Sphingopyxis sp. TaxID=1908224 RepID=UPI002DF759BB|nr:TonB-dependent receptor [Sphingopyxis sp.]